MASLLSSQEMRISETSRPAGAEEKAVVERPTAGQLSHVAAIARNTFRESVRDKVLYNLVFFVLLLTGVAVFLSDLTAAEEFRLIVNLGLSAVLLFGVFIAIFVGVGLVYKEIERRTVYAIFSKPVGRGEFLVGKYLGLCLTLLVNLLVMGVGVTIALLLVGRPQNPSALSIWPALLLIYFELLIITAVALFFSSFSSPALSALLTFLVFIIGHFSADLKAFAASIGTTGARYFFGALYYLLPNLSNFSFITPAAHGQMPDPLTAALSAAYAILYVAVLLLAATAILNSRNFK
jgi:ABC-type transport system involved in multi-copper enzyme maturation permease subunit